MKREYLIDEVWQGDTEFVDAHALTVAIKRLRDKLEEDVQKPKYIKTIYGIGYTWAVKNDRKMIWVAGIFLLSGVFWYCIFYQKEKGF